MQAPSLGASQPYAIRLVRAVDERRRPVCIQPVLSQPSPPGRFRVRHRRPPDRPLTVPRDEVADLSSHPYDIVVVGAGILGLATARELLQRHPHYRLLVVNKEPGLAAHQTGHNSGVLHAGLYYQPGSLKARLCRAGKATLERYAQGAASK